MRATQQMYGMQRRGELLQAPSTETPLKYLDSREPTPCHWQHSAAEEDFFEEEE